MATLVSTNPTRWQRLLGVWHNYFLPGDVTTLFMALVVVLLPVFSLSAAGWDVQMETLVPVALLSVVLGFVLARSQYSELFGLLISTIYGGCAILLIAALRHPDGIGAGIYNVFSSLFLWLEAALGDGLNQDPLVFTLLISGLFWLLGHNLAWHLFRIDRVWRALLPIALVLITNSVYYTGAANLDIYLIAFTFLALLLIIRSNLDAREWDWYVNGIRIPRRLRRHFYRIGGLLALIVLLVAWTIPMNDIQDRLNRFQEFLQSDPLVELSELWNRLIFSPETRGPTTSDYYGGDSLQLSGAIRLGDEVVFLVDAPPERRYYWRSRVFTNYNSGQGSWTSSATHVLRDPQPPLEIAQEPLVPGARVAVEQQFTMGLNASRLVYTAPQPLRVELATRANLSYADIDDPASPMFVSVVRPMEVLYEGDTYDAVSWMSAATAQQLRAAGTNYPQWVRDTYRQIYPTPLRVLQLAQQIVRDAGAATPYDQAVAVESWLRTNIEYNEVIPSPPMGQDPVEWFLFDLRQGYCNYYASAMVLMLRSLDIPARMAAGFAQGEWNAAENAFVVRERDAHTWVEVYFPGYGWVEFEPTAAQAPINRGDQPIPVAQQPPTQPPPTPTPLPTLTPTPSPSPTPEPPPDNPTDEAVTEPQAEPPTVTPTFTPSPTATPVIVPTQPPPIRPEPRDPFAFILPALGMALVGVFLIVLLLVALLFIYWWWEWRGMRTLSPISRAYARLERYLGLIGLRMASVHTPDERRDRIVRELPVADRPVTAITGLYTNERYGPPRPLRHKRAERAWSDARLTILGRFLRRTLMPWRRRRGTTQ
ncbi:MAG: hypothetical protein GYB67_16165 [Chloroflexi bacterium]|nr:hypothetical protein [Chloroflexota bacterium]